MSFLLDALRKSEQQRRLGETPSIQVPILGRAESKPQRSRKMLLALGLVVIAMLFWLLFLQYSADDDASLVENADNGAGSQASSAAPNTALDNPALANTPANPAVGRAASPAAEVNNSAGSETGPTANNGPLLSALSGENQEQAVSDFNRLATEIAEREARAREVRQQQVAQQAQLEEQQKQAAQQLPQQAATQTDVEPEQLTVASSDTTPAEGEWEPAKPTYINYFELPLNVRQSLPEFSVSIRVFDEVPEKRFVIIGRERVFEGDEVPGADGVELVEIKRQSLILEYQGYVFESQ